MNCDGFAGTPVIVFCDGSKGDGDAAAVEQTRAVAKELLGEQAEYRFATSNHGLAKSIIAGVTGTVERYGRVIVVEDDLDLNPGFLTYMNDALDRYSEATDVYQVSGYTVTNGSPTSSAAFFPFTVSWGWATWKRAWDRFDPTAKGWERLRTDKSLRKRFNLDGAYDYATMLWRQMAGRGDSWAIRWYWTVFSLGGLVLFPPTTLVRNSGFDGSGTHGRGALRKFASESTAGEAISVVLADAVRLDDQAFRAIKQAMWRRNGGWLGHLVDRARKMLWRA
jgi:hypothetical protein